MKKIYIFLFFLIGTSSVSAWESKITIDCINENLEPCSSSNMTSNKSNENFDIDLNKSDKNKKKEVNKIIKIEKEKKIVKKEIKKKKKEVKNNEKKKEKLVKKETKKKEKKIKVANVKNENIYFEKFKNLVINYSNTTGYPDINN